jgi:hypothetical protein
MAERPLRVRALLFLYGNGNIAGCGLALLGPALLFAGVIERGWLPITLGLYAIGWLLAPRPPELARRIEDSLTIEQAIDRLDALVARARPHLTDTMAASLDRIRTSVGEVLPRLLDGPAHDDQLYTVRETVLRYLPETLANYVALPPAFRAGHGLKEGRTARDLMTEQLALLDVKLQEVVVNLAASDAQALLANGRFLEARFRQPDFLSG